ncbi:hypothetical protein FKW77_000577 [Venturia effusa]|uniref:BTB domain-containing protein n=1 Tax=Venturia effusa TaxID=50376 RepID=A0A517KYW3_9PEZI|nr:hypothetical protein FKW77_000577 [Venturia effusa]
MSGSAWQIDNFAPIKSAVLRGFESGEYHDLVLECQEYQFQVHKLIVCLQSSWLAKAVKEKKKPGASIQLPEENPHIASAMLHYLYSATYTYPPTYNTQDFSVLLPPSMLFHLHLYSLAETLLIQPLKALAQTRFQEVVEQEWHTEIFPDTVKRVYEVTNPETGGAQLRAIVVQIAALHGKELVGKGGAFGVMMSEVAEFGRDVFQVMMGGPVVELPHAVEKEKMIRYECPVCSFEFYAKAIERNEITCSGCGAVSQEGIWRGDKDDVNASGEADTNGVHAIGEANMNGIVVQPEIEADGTEDKVEWYTMKANGECVKDTDPAVKTSPVKSDEEDAAVKEVQKTNEDWKELKDDHVNGCESDLIREIATEPEATTKGVMGNSVPERADSANGDGSVGGGEVKEVVWEVEQWSAAPKKKKGKKNRKDKMSPANVPTSGPTSPRATEAQVMGW